MAINLGFTPSLGRNISTVIVASFFDQWASAVGHAEADPNTDFFMAVGGARWDDAQKGPTLLLVTHGTLDEISQHFRDTKDLVGYFTVNISDILRRLRARAHAAGIDLTRPFFFPPGDPRFDQILTQVKRERDLRVARVRRGKQKFAAAQERRRPRNITALRRVEYPLALQPLELGQ